MPKKFTNHNQLLALLYQELSPVETPSVLNDLANQPTSQQELNDMADIIGRLTEAELDPHPTSVSIILEYSAKTKSQSFTTV